MRKHESARSALDCGSGAAAFAVRVRHKAVAGATAPGARGPAQGAYSAFEPCRPLVAARSLLFVGAILLLFAVPALTVPPADVAFSGEHAFADLKRLAAFGPRPSASEALEHARMWISQEIAHTGFHVEEDPFPASTPIGVIPMTNLIVKIPGETPKVVILAGHYDTKRFDGFSFVGANDGGSSAAFLMEMARVLAHRKNKFTIWLVFFDGEEAIQQWTATDSRYGSRHLVEKLTASGELGSIGAMILVDMIGDAKLDIYRDANSTAWLTDVVFAAARRLGYARNFIDEKRAYEDDHLPFVNAGVAAVDLLDLDFGPNGSYWHTAKDTVDKCSPASLAIVGRVVMATLEELEKSPHLK